MRKTERKKEVRFVTYRVRYVEGAMRVERERERKEIFRERGREESEREKDFEAKLRGRQG